MGLSKSDSIRKKTKLLLMLLAIGIISSYIDIFDPGGHYEKSLATTDLTGGVKSHFLLLICPSLLTLIFIRYELFYYLWVINYIWNVFWYIIYYLD
jgi:hypothetical protein